VIRTKRNPAWYLLAVLALAIGCVEQSAPAPTTATATAPTYGPEARPPRPSVETRLTWIEGGTKLQTGCTSAVLRHFKVKKWGYSQCTWDIVKTLEYSGWTVEYYNTDGETVDELKRLQPRGTFVVAVDSHVLLVVDGKAVVDTDPPCLVDEQTGKRTSISFDVRPIEELYYITRAQ